jgi:hypothetical protein
VRTILGVAFIAAVAAGGAIAWFTPTVAHGSALAEVLFDPDPHRTVTCDDDVPIGATGARFACRAVGDDGSTAAYALTLDRDGAVHMKLVGRTPATHAPPARDGDPWTR